MKKNLFILLIAFGAFSNASAQKFGYLDLEYITSRMPEYKKVQTDFDELVTRWTKEISDKLVEVERLEKTYRAEEVLLTDDMKQKRLQTITDKQKDAREFQNKVFGIDGLMTQRKKDLMKPLLDQLGKAVEKVARQKQLMFLFDKSADGLAMVYTDPRHDYTDYVMEELGISTDQIKEKQEKDREKASEEAPKADAPAKKGAPVKLELPKKD